MPQFTILSHDHPFPHWDLLLDPDGVGGLWSWRIHSLPAQSGLLVAERLPDHRRMYLDYEGPVSRGRGTVQRWDTGIYYPVQSTAGTVRYRCRGERLQGEIQLQTVPGELGTYEYLPDR